MNIKRQKLNIALGHLTAWLLFFPALILLPSEESRRDLIARLALAPWDDLGRTGNARPLPGHLRFLGPSKQDDGCECV